MPVLGHEHALLFQTPFSVYFPTDDKQPSMNGWKFELDETNGFLPFNFPIEFFFFYI